MRDEPTGAFAAGAVFTDPASQPVLDFDIVGPGLTLDDYVP